MQPQTDNCELLQQLYILGAAVASELGRVWAPIGVDITSTDFYTAQCKKPSKDPYVSVRWPANTAKNRNIQKLISDYTAAGEIEMRIQHGSFEAEFLSSNVFWIIHKFEQLCKIKSNNKFRIKFQLINNTYIPTIMAKKIIETPMMKQYAEMKAKHPDAMLLFRIGDFYEIFGEDAVAAADILGITLTRRRNAPDEYVEIAGFPHHALDSYLPKMVRAGKRVAICEQLEDPKLVKKGISQEPDVVDVEATEVKEEPKEEPVKEEPKEIPSMKDELRECALAQLPTGAEIIAAKYVPIGDDNGKWQLVLKIDDAYKYADIVAMARYLYICGRVFETAEEVKALVGIETAKPDPTPTPDETDATDATDATDEADMKKMFIDEYDMDVHKAKSQAALNVRLRNLLTSEKSVTFAFIKKDGTERTAHGTLHADVVPEVNADPNKPKREPNPKVQIYWDLDKQQWRSFDKAKLTWIINAPETTETTETTEKTEKTEEATE